MDASTTLAGKGLYLELTNNEYTTQMLVIPEGITSRGDKKTTTLLRRTVSKWSPRKTWQQDNAHSYKAELTSKLVPDGSTAKFQQVDDGDSELMALENLWGANQLLTHLVSKEWALRDKPLALEISVADIDDLAAYKTPAALMRRVTRARKAAGFPDDLFPA